MAAQHTSGPWLRDGNTIYALMHHRWSKGVEEFRNRFTTYVQADKECTDEEHESNCRLIAAAPDLLAACKALQMEAAARGCGLRIADEAIQKATGAPVDTSNVVLLKRE